jgi:RHS repeat-associated protein
VHHAAGSTTVPVNQEAGGGTWFLLGAFDFNAGPASVTLTDQANDYVIADAVMLLPPGSAPNTGTWTPNVPQAAQYEVYARWTSHANRASNATYTITHAGGSTAVPANQQSGGGAWNLLGTFSFAPGTAHTIALTDQANGYVIADAIRLVPLAAPAQPRLHFIHVDHLNTPRLVADAAGTTVWKWDQQEPFGNNPADENPSGLGIFDLPLRLPGQTYDKETGLHHNYFRDFDPSLGIYNQSDPIGLKGGINTYAYVSGSPLRNIDPFGLKGMCFDFVVRSLESFDYKILSTVGDCPPQFLITGFFNPNKQLPGQRFTKTCDSGQCVNQKDISQISWTNQEFEFSLCWTYGGTVAFNVPCIKGQRSCRVKIEITTKGSVQGWTGECQCKG